MKTNRNSAERQGLVGMALRLHLHQPAAITAVAFLVRLLVILVFRTYRLPVIWFFSAS
jgi:hypothetical protein